MASYYNEHDPKAAAWLRALIKEKVIPDGEVDERSIVDVHPADLGGFTQCHFFAGIGGWPEALRLAGWPDDRPVWTGSCPCQSFSVAGQGKGFADERHLWPSWFHLIAERLPSVVFGEQVDAAIRYGWLDLVQTDLEGIGYAFGAAVIPAAGVGAPHGRHRICFVAESDHAERRPTLAGWNDRHGHQARRHEGNGEPGERSEAGRLAITDRAGLRSWREGRTAVGHGEATGADCGAGELGVAEQQGLEGHAGYVDYPRGRSFALGSVAASGAVGGFWRDAEVVYCRDGKLRPVEPGTFPLAHGLPARVGRLRGYGNAIVPQVAAEFIRAYALTVRDKP